jgi:hypothetical protein
MEVIDKSYIEILIMVKFVRFFCGGKDHDKIMIPKKDTQKGQAYSPKLLTFCNYS